MIKKYKLISGAILLLIGACINVTATTDATNDIWHQIVDETNPLGIAWQAFDGSKNNIDITDISYTTTEAQVIFTMTVAGTIQDSNMIQYGIYVTLSDPNPYNPYADTVVWNAHYGNGFETITDADSSNGGDITDDAGTSTWTVIFDVDNPDNVTEFFGFAAEYTSITDLTSGEYWVDYAPDTAHPSYASLPDNSENTGDDTSTETNNNNSNSSETSEEDPSSTPGFELIILLGSFTIAIIIIRRKQ